MSVSAAGLSGAWCGVVLLLVLLLSGVPADGGQGGRERQGQGRHRLPDGRVCQGTQGGAGQAADRHTRCTSIAPPSLSWRPTAGRLGPEWWWLTRSWCPCVPSLGLIDQVVELLVNAGADVNAQNSDGHTALMFAYNGRNQVGTTTREHAQHPLTDRPVIEPRRSHQASRQAGS